MSIPLSWVDRIFTKLTLVYGRDFLARWEGLEISSVKTDWGHELSSLGDWPEAIAYGLTNLPVDRPPTALQFRQICRAAPSRATIALPEPKADPARVAAELARLGTLRSRRVAPAGAKDWAHQLKARHQAGEPLNANQIKSYKTALRSAA